MPPYHSQTLADPTIVSALVPSHSRQNPVNAALEIEVPIAGSWMVAGAGFSLIGVILLMWNSRLTLDLHTPVNGVLLFAAALACSIRYAYRVPASRAQRIARDAAEYIGLFTMICVLGALASYPAAVKTTGYVDVTLERIDQVLHFNWVAWYDITAAHRSLQILGGIAYASIYVTPLVLLSYFAQASRKADARAFIAAFWVAAVLTLILFMAFPARGPLAFLVGAHVPYMPTSALYQSELIPVLRDGSFSQVSFGALRGLVCAPSFHTTSAVLFMLTVWPIRSLRWPIIAVNCAMLLSIPVEGTHYLADMIGGALVALVAFTALKVISRKLLLRRIIDNA